MRLNIHCYVKCRPNVVNVVDVGTRLAFIGINQIQSNIAIVIAIEFGVRSSASSDRSIDCHIAKVTQRTRFVSIDGN